MKKYIYLNDRSRNKIESALHEHIVIKLAVTKFYGKRYGIPSYLYAAYEERCKTVNLLVQKKVHIEKEKNTFIFSLSFSSFSIVVYAIYVWFHTREISIAI